MMCSFAVMSVRFCEHTQSLIKSRISAFFFFFQHVFQTDCVRTWCAVNVDGELVSLQLFGVGPFRSKRGSRQ